MREIELRRWHRNAAIVSVPFIVFQVGSGLFLSGARLFGFVTEGPGGVIRNLPPPMRPADMDMLMVHFSAGGPVGALYRTALAAAVLWLVFSGSWLFLKVRARSRPRR
ncbi:MAG: hypothetical protein M1531_08330 [Chloroflexi bacterium]|nr:hypothetical protein [Chloroflexota bacterium]